MNNSIFIDDNASVSKVKFEIVGSNNRIRIGKNVILRNSVIHVGDSGSKLIIKDNVDVGINAQWAVLEGTKVEIGKGCMFSTNSHLASSDSHSIIGLAGNRVNKAQNIIIGERVWFGEDVTCLKGAKIGSGSIFGSRSLITAGSYEKNAVYVGIPCRKIRGNVHWLLERIK